ncbi:hypothetical protein B9Z55_017322 [Caenorhabditis nigoni]|uniref:G-protein coupled receptors family 1 profile domain-containing protein n=1 Tax=Caenorhabditis nigoni TaxID=1611254 RepID=A0A2G5T8X3_9PELO|nr:hypothetical protein B9Z55_017322 [Caenorhabditis nigoni]
MRTIGINVFLIGIAISDFFVMSILTYQHLLIFLQQGIPLECIPPSNPIIQQFNFYLAFIKDDFRRLSTYLGLLMAFVRFLIMKNALNPNFEFLSKPRFSLKSILISFSCSSLLSSYYFARVKFVELPKKWIPAPYCGYSPNYSTPEFTFLKSDNFFSATSLFEIMVMFDGILKIVPAVLLPILAILLLRELKLAEDSRRKISVARATRNNSKDHTSKLVICMTISSIIAEGPTGVAVFIQGLATNHSGLLSIINDIISILLIFVTLNATTHFIICVGISKQYRNAVRKLLGYEKPTKAFRKIGTEKADPENWYRKTGSEKPDQNTGSGKTDPANWKLENSAPYGYLFTIFDFWTPAIADDARRCRTWFAFLMALLRYLILRSDLNPKLGDISKPKVVLKIMMVPFVISTCMSIFFWGRFIFVEGSLWFPPDGCTNYPSGYSQMTFISKVGYGLYYYSLPLRIFNLVDGILKLIPTLMFPLLTFLLIHELRRTKNSIKMSQGIKQEDSKGDHTTKLVVMMTISFMTAESPFGIIYFMEGVITEPPGFM